MTATTRGVIVLLAALVWTSVVVVSARALAPLVLGQDSAGSLWREGLFTLALFALLAMLPIALLARHHALASLLGREAGRWAWIGTAIGVSGFTVTIVYAWLAGVLVPAAGGWAGIVPFVFGTLVVLCQSASEELVFRGWLQSELERAWRPQLALAATALAFAALHVLGGARAPLSLLNLLLGGVLFGLLAQRSRGLAAPIAAHGGWNWSEQMLFGTDPNPGRSAFGALFDHDLAGSSLWGGSSEGINASLAMTIALAALIAPLLTLRDKDISLRGTMPARQEVSS